MEKDYFPVIEQFVKTRLSGVDLKQMLHEYAGPYRELMAYYRCAMMEVEAKFKVLSEELSLQSDHNPIETIKTRLKKPESILEKASARNIALNPEDLEQGINDIAGVRVICSFVSDIYMLADALLKQDDITLIRRKDYIQNPKPNGYRSLHLIVEIPIFLHDRKRLMKVEVQLRTIAMDWWASSEHKIRYKRNCQTQFYRRLIRIFWNAQRSVLCLMQKWKKYRKRHWTVPPPFIQALHLHLFPLQNQNVMRHSYVKYYKTSTGRLFETPSP